MRRVLLAAAIVLAMLPIGLAPTATVRAAPNDITAIVIEGVGYGHGRGMSQWGAYGWAVDQGKGWRWILDHYYGGTVLGDATGRIRVRLTGLDGEGTVGVVSHGPGVRWGGHTRAAMYAREVSANRFDVYGATTPACPGGAALVVPDGPISEGSTNQTAVRRIQTFLNAFRVAGDAILVVDGNFGPLTRARLVDWQDDQGLPADGIWNADDAARARALIGSGGTTNWVKLGSATGPVTFGSSNANTSSAAPHAVLGVCDGGRVTHYRGRIEVRSTSGGNRVVNDVKVEDYLRGVVPREISASWATAGGGRGRNAVRAQAVAARSFGLSQSRYSYARTCDTQSCQVYAGSATRATATSSPVPVEHPDTDAAIVDTAGKVRRWPDGRIVSTEFSASNGPRTAGGAFPPVDDAPGDGTERNPNHRWTRVLDADQLARRYGVGAITAASMTEASSSVFRQFDGVWFNDIVLEGTNGTVRQQAWDFRSTHGLPSPGFTVRVIRENTTNRSIGFIGDSVGVGVAGGADAELQRVIDGTFEPVVVDTVVGRCTVTASCPGTSGVEAARALPRGLDTVVVELGYNDWPATFPSAIDQMMSALSARDVGRVVWINLADVRRHGDGSSFYAPSNAALGAARSRWPSLTVLNWNAATDHGERSRWLSDGVHLTATGQAEFVLWLRAKLLQLGRSHRLAPPKRLEVPIVGRSLTGPDGTATTVPASAAAVALNVTAVRGEPRGHAVVWPCGTARPVASNVNYMDRYAVANNVIAPIGPNGAVCLYASRATDIVVDVAGWFPDGGPSASFVGLRPERLADTRSGVGGRSTKVSPSAPLRVAIAGVTGDRATGGEITVPAGVRAAALNVTTVGASRHGHVVVWPCGVARPNASSVNVRPGDAVPNGVIAPVGAGGEVCIWSSVAVDIVVDLAGWFGATTGSGFHGTTPERVIDTRLGTGGRTGPVAPSAPLRIPVRGRALRDGARRVNVPADATAVFLNLTAVQPAGRAHATVWPCGRPRPEASSVNFRPGVAVANGVIAPIGTDGSVCVYVRRSVDLVVDIAGWFDGGTTPSFVAATPTRVVDTRANLGPAPT